MPDCPNDLALLRIVEGRATDDELRRWSAHASHCPACQEAFATLAATNLREVEGTLPPVSGEETRRALRRLRQLARATDAKNSTVSSFPLPGLTTLGGLGALVSRLAGPAAPIAGPMFAGADGEKHDPSVRNDANAASGSGEHTTDDALGFAGDSATASFHDAMTQSDPAKQFGEVPAGATPQDIYQGYSDTCAIRSQEIVLRDFGVHISQEQLIAEATQRGWYQPGHGTSPEAVGNLLEAHGVQVQRFENANIFNLSNELAQGHKVIIGVDAGELWDRGIGERVMDFIGLEQPDHALIVSSIDTTDPKNVKVILTDPGTGQVAAEYPMEQFIDAWKDSNCFMVSTVEPAPVFAPGMENFNYATGHLATVGELPYATFAELHDFALAPDTDVMALGRLELIFSQAAHHYHDLQLQFGQPMDFDAFANQPLNDFDATLSRRLISLAQSDPGVADPLHDFFHLDPVEPPSTPDASDLDAGQDPGALS
ncbi:hypothetical protein [Opitutus sp. ER46]|uniref:hypothetical protein n=1 Tax=Opitutus sp. ER46 TaxID=2161864 RepID=UPI000D30FF54|nr:hypothetical protein [Opitutus sp. ER46]PTX91199.1 hypothetical protein DB354_21445 [Opitutus sp. ER46]